MDGSWPTVDGATEHDHPYVDRTLLRRLDQCIAFDGAPRLEVIHSMSPEQFLAARQNDWQRLTQLLDRRIGLNTAEVEEIGRLYRGLAADLALAQRDFPGHPLSRYLNQLTGRAHAAIYRGQPLATRRLWRFISQGLPRLYRQTLPFTLFAAALLFLPALIAGTATALAPETGRWLLPAGAQGLIEQIERQDLWLDIPLDERPFASSAITTNNIQVSFLAFAGGIFAGVLTVVVLVQNGLLLGAITGLTIHYGVGWELWNFVIGHGVIELSMICLAGGAGLMLGWAIIQPGIYTRRDALRHASRRAVKLVLGCASFLVVAGLIEGFVSPSETLPPGLKWGVGLSSGALLYGYLLLAGRPRRHRGRA